MSSASTIERPADTPGFHGSRLNTDDTLHTPPLTFEQFLRLRWDYAEGGGVRTEDPAHIPLVERFLAAKSDPQKLRAFIEDLGGTWDATPYSPDET
jgi:hypothetical protein